MHRYFIFNWKNYLTPPAGDPLLEILKKGADQFLDDTFIVAPDALHLGRYFTGQGESRLLFAAQDIASSDDFPFTGSLSLEQVHNTISHVIVGHSERRRYALESEEIIAQKVQSVASSDKQLIFCVGEMSKTFDYTDIKVQLAHQLESLTGYPREVLLCYEPSWAIGTGATPAQDILAEIFSFISSTCDDFGLGGLTHLIYGGSVNHENIDAILAVPKCEGVIIGTAGTSTESVGKILETL